MPKKIYLIPRRFSRKNITLTSKHINFINDKTVYIHIPKCAGTTIGNCFNIKKTFHTTVQDVSQISKYESLSQNLTTFSFVRHPYSRFLSLFNYAKMKKSHYHNNTLKGVILGKNHKDYELLKRSNLLECLEYLEKGDLKHDNTWNQWMPQYTWLKNQKGEIAVDHIEKIENLNIGLKRISQKYNIQYTEPDHLNLSKKYHKELNEDQKAKIYRFYRKDFEYFQYEP